MNGYQAIANAVVEQAADDYRRALCEAKKWENRIKESRQFFNGDQIQVYTSLDGPTLQHMIEDEVKTCNYQYVEGEVADMDERKERKMITKLRKNLLNCISTVEELKAAH